MSEFVSDDHKGAAIEIAGFGAAGFAGASLGAYLSKLDGATNKWNQVHTSESTSPKDIFVNHNFLTAGEVFGPIALGAVAGLALMRRLRNRILEA